MSDKKYELNEKEQEQVSGGETTQERLAHSNVIGDAEHMTCDSNTFYIPGRPCTLCNHHFAYDGTWYCDISSTTRRNTDW